VIAKNKNSYYTIAITLLSVSVALRSKAYVCSRSHTEIAVSNPAGTCCSSVKSFVFSQVEVSAKK